MIKTALEKLLSDIENIDDKTLFYVGDLITNDGRRHKNDGKERNRRKTVHANIKARGKIKCKPNGVPVLYNLTPYEYIPIEGREEEINREIEALYDSFRAVRREIELNTLEPDFTADNIRRYGEVLSKNIDYHLARLLWPIYMLFNPGKVPNYDIKDLRAAIPINVLENFSTAKIKREYGEPVAIDQTHKTRAALAACLMGWGDALTGVISRMIAGDQPPTFSSSPTNVNYSIAPASLHLKDCFMDSELGRAAYAALIAELSDERITIVGDDYMRWNKGTGNGINVACILVHKLSYQPYFKAMKCDLVIVSQIVSFTFHITATDEHGRTSKNPKAELIADGIISTINKKIGLK